jgi:hypothetical protein
MSQGKLMGPEELFDENSRGKNSHEKEVVYFASLPPPHFHPVVRQRYDI